VATVEVRFSALPAHVRTARLVAAALARRSGIDEAVLDDVRLAVGEACSRAVDLHRAHCPDRPVTVTLVDHDDTFEVSVADEAPSMDEATSSFAEIAESAESADLDSADLEASVPPGIGLAVISGLVDDMDITAGRDGGVVVRMTWPTSA
jgi:serine/threonine-protein kinase RsbW